MKIQDIASLQGLETYLREFTCWGDDEFVYDEAGVVKLFLALLDNMKTHSLDVELEDIGYRFYDPQREFIMKVATFANRITDSDIEAEED